MYLNLGCGYYVWLRTMYHGPKLADCASKDSSTLMTLPFNIFPLTPGVHEAYAISGWSRVDQGDHALR